MCDEHREFKDMKLFYRFRKDDGTFPLDSEAKVFMRGQRIYEKYEHTRTHHAENKQTTQACLTEKSCEVELRMEAEMLKHVMFEHFNADIIFLLRVKLHW